MKKNRYLKKLTLLGLAVLLALSFSSAAFAQILQVTPSHFVFFTGWSYGYSASIYADEGDIYFFSGGDVTQAEISWNGLTISVNPLGAIYVSGSPTASGFTTIQLAEAVTSGDQKIVMDIAPFSISCISETSTMPTGSSLSLDQLKISDRDGYHAPTYLRPLRSSLIEIPIVQPIDDDGYGNPDIMGVYVYGERDGEEVSKAPLPANSKLPGDLSADGYRYDASSNTLWVNYYTYQTGEYTFKFYYYQDGTLRLQTRILTGEIPGGDSGSGGCATGAGLAAMVLAAGFAVTRRRR